MTETLIQAADRAAIYNRISHDAAGDEHGVTNQDNGAEQLCDSRGLSVVARFSDNDISASNGDYRPDYHAMMAAAARREFDAIVVFQTSRLWRNRRERADGIEILRKAEVSVIAVKGPSLDMSTAYGRGMAGLLGEFDTMETEVKSERQKFAAEAAARGGKRWTGCPRPFGYAADHLTPDPGESRAIQDAARMLLGGSTIAAVARDWSARGLRPPQAPCGPLPRVPWTRNSVTAILRNPRIAGLGRVPGRADRAGGRRRGRLGAGAAAGDVARGRRAARRPVAAARPRHPLPARRRSPLPVRQHHQCQHQRRGRPDLPLRARHP